ncbi:bZIP transcription factor domain-containing protein [Sarocladium implicatum]|nr:bZIP transcription factor domain-containing protein [Sarocladium implicatum]
METKLDSYERRRQQVRKAQITHRERKAAYVRSLENEIEELRKRNAALAEEAKAGQEMIRRLQEAMLCQGVPFPPGCFPDSQCHHQDAARVNVVGGPFPHQTLEVTYSSSEASTTAVEQLGEEVVHVATNFILALEQPCLYHFPTPKASLTRMNPTGHATMLSTPLIARSPNFEVDPNKAGFPQEAEWSASPVELEHLLRTSQRLGLYGEVTPVQIWHFVQRHEKFPLVTTQDLGRLKDLLLPLVDCQHFGAIVPESEFEEVIDAFFGTI